MIDLRARVLAGILFALRSLFLLLIIKHAGATHVIAFPGLTPEDSHPLITEFQYDPPGLDNEREWVEVANLGEAAIQLSGFKLGDEEQQGGGEGMLRFPASSTLAPGAVAVIAQTAVGYRALFGHDPHFEIVDSDTTVPDMLGDNDWAGGQFALANDGDELLLLNEDDEIVDALNYGDRISFFAPAIPLVINGQSVERNPAFCDTDSAIDWLPSTPNPGRLSREGECRSLRENEPSTNPSFRAIGEIQGAGSVSPLLGRIVTFRGIVTGMRENQNVEGTVYYTLFVQDTQGQDDGDPATSDALAVFLGRQRPQFTAGDQVVVTGQVTEYFGMTEIDDLGLQIELDSPDHPLPTASLIDLPPEREAALGYLESLEGMLVVTEGSLPVIGPTHPGCGFALAAHADASRAIQHNDSDPIFPALLVLSQSDVDCSELPGLKTGDRVTGVAGPLTYDFNHYKVVQQQIAQLEVQSSALNPLVERSKSAADELSIATLNMDNYLRQPDGLWSPQDEQDEMAILQIKKQKIGQAIRDVLGCPALLAVQEVESEALLMNLAVYTAELCGFTYQVSHRESADARGIDVALLSDPRRIEITRIERHQTCSHLATGVLDSMVRCPPAEEPLFSRPPLEVAIQIENEPLTIIVNHFKSKRGGVIETAPRRLLQAQHVYDLVKKRLSEDPQAGIIVLGDFNDYDESAVWQALQKDGVLIDVLADLPARERYTYIFDGTAQLIDGILVSPALAHRIARVAIPHVNADFPISMATDVSSLALPYRASDHDPILLSLSKSPEAVPDTSPSSGDKAVQPAPQSSAVITSRPTTELQPVLSANAADTRDQEPVIDGEFVPQKMAGSIMNRLAAVLLVLIFAAVIAIVIIWIGAKY